MRSQGAMELLVDLDRGGLPKPVVVWFFGSYTFPNCLLNPSVAPFYYCNEQAIWSI
jgi:hypothetical protein